MMTGPDMMRDAGRRSAGPDHRHQHRAGLRLDRRPDHAGGADPGAQSAADRTDGNKPGLQAVELEPDAEWQPRKEGPIPTDPPDKCHIN